MAVTGRPDSPGLVAPVALTAAADGALAALRALAPDTPLPASGAALLGERVRLLGLSRQGSVSPNGTCRLLATRDGTVALNLPRTEDWELLPALFGEAAAGWDAVAQRTATMPGADLIARARLLGLAIADAAGGATARPFTITRAGVASTTSAPPLVVDLSSLWAGPLAGALLQAAGARVVKVESRRRPDGARGGHAGFFDLLNAGKASVALDFADAGDLVRLRHLIDRADIVIESARPRALAALGIVAEDVARRGGTWISITGHGRIPPAADWIGFGDDASVAGGLAAAMARGWGAPSFAGDAIADPLTGITAAFAGWASWLSGGGRVVALALAEVVAHACALYEADAAELRAWQALAEADEAPLYPLRTPIGPAAALGADNTTVLA